MQRWSRSIFWLTGAPAPGGREAAEPGGGKRRGGAERCRLDQIRPNSAVGSAGSQLDRICLNQASLWPLVLLGLHAKLRISRDPAATDVSTDIAAGSEASLPGDIELTFAWARPRPQQGHAS